ncbi:MAG: bglA3 [Ignavibacteria bacterium]|nr:MAG: bglA3 [Ignavibacteria bacterium]KAF0161991.1 MAG: bglA3 [Ignavibacteria bacterium]
MKKIFLLFLVIVSQNVNAQSWKLVWSDEFNGSAINTSDWTFETGNNNGWGNNELQFYTGRPENATIVKGELIITAREESFGGRSYTSARMKTQAKKNFKYGRIEAYIKIPLGQGSWPAFWMLGENISTLGWPKCGEIDIMEHINNETFIHGTVHWANSSGSHTSTGTKTSFDPNIYNLYAIEWTETQIRWYINSRLYNTFYIVNNINNTEAFHKPFFIILNLAIGGRWPGSPNGTMQFPIEMKVDYVRVYEMVTNVEENKTIPLELELLQNYPNPFNPETTISYRLSAFSKVSLKVYDVFGQEVATLVNKLQPAGTYNLKLNTHNYKLSSGVYFYQLRALDPSAGSGQGFVETKKFVLMK